MKPIIKKYFQFSRRERNGVFLLLFVLCAIIVLKYTIPLWATIDDSQAQKLFNENAIQLQQLDKKSNTSAPFGKLQSFNPNTYSYDSLLASGLTEKLARQIINYRAKIGAFKSKADFAKLYNLTDSIYSVLEPYILLPETIGKETVTTTSKKVIVELNTADSLQLLAVKGIGPFFAHKILEYRRQLGGYFTLNQLGEAFYINANTLAEKEQRMAEIKAQLTVNPAHIKKLNINTSTQKELSRHPYISYKQSKAIIKYREKKGLFTGESDLTASGIFSVDEYAIVAHYISY